MFSTGDYVVINGLSERLDGIEGTVKKQHNSMYSKTCTIITQENKELKISTLYLKKTEKHINYRELMNVALDNKDFVWCLEIFNKLRGVVNGF